MPRPGITFSCVVFDGFTVNDRCKAYKSIRTVWELCEDRGFSRFRTEKHPVYLPFSEAAAIAADADVGRVLLMHKASGA